MSKEELLSKKESEKQQMKEYLRLKFEVEDWHGVADAAMDLREIEAEIKILKNIWV